MTCSACSRSSVNVSIPDLLTILVSQAIQSAPTLKCVYKLGQRLGNDYAYDRQRGVAREGCIDCLVDILAIPGDIILVTRQQPYYGAALVFLKP